MNRHRVLGEIAFPTFMLAWAAGAMLALVQLQPAAALDDWAPAWERGAEPSAAAHAELAPVPTLDDPVALREALGNLAAHSDVMNGSWQPVGPGRSAPVPAPAGVVEVAEPEVAPAAVERVAAPIASIGTASRTVTRTGSRGPVEIASVGGRAAEPESRAVVRKRPVTAPPARLVAEKAAARVALEAGQFAEAYARLRPAVAEARGDAEYLGLLALAAMGTGSEAEALVIYQHLAALEPGVPRWRVGLALAQESLGLDASDAYRDALALGDVDPGVRTQLRDRLGGGGPSGFS